MHCKIKNISLIINNRFCFRLNGTRLLKQKRKMAQLNFGGVTENVVTREEFPLEKAREVLKNETIAVIG